MLPQQRPNSKLSKPYKDAELGLDIEGKFEADSGFDYLVGNRDCKNFTVKEFIAKGLGISYLCGFALYDSKDELIVSYAFRNLPYTRDLSRKKVGKALVKYFEDAMKRAGHNFPKGEVKAKVDKILDDAYYAESDRAALAILEEWGIL